MDQKPSETADLIFSLVLLSTFLTGNRTVGNHFPRDVEHCHLWVRHSLQPTVAIGTIGFMVEEMERTTPGQNAGMLRNSIEKSVKT